MLYLIEFLIQKWVFSLVEDHFSSTFFQFCFRIIIVITQKKDEKKLSYLFNRN